MTVLFETKEIALTGTPIDLVADTHFNVQPDLFSVFVFVQNTGSREVLWRETETAPGADDTGHKLPAGAGIVIQLIGAFWIWSPDGSTILASPGSPMPVREA